MWYQWFIAGAEDHHRAALGLLGVVGELARDGDDLVARHAGDRLRPGRRIGHVVVVGLGDVARRRSRGRRRNWRRTGRTPWRPAPRRPSACTRCAPARCASARSGWSVRGEVVVRACRRNRGTRRRRARRASSVKRQRAAWCRGRRRAFSSRFHLPCSPQRKPTEPLRHHDVAVGLVEGDASSTPDCWSRRARRRNRRRAASGPARRLPSCFTSRTSIGRSV